MSQLAADRLCEDVCGFFFFFFCPLAVDETVTGEMDGAVHAERRAGLLCMLYESSSSSSSPSHHSPLFLWGGRRARRGRSEPCAAPRDKLAVPVRPPSLKRTEGAAARLMPAGRCCPPRRGGRRSVGWALSGRPGIQSSTLCERLRHLSKPEASV